MERKRLRIKVNILAGIICAMMLLCLLPGRVSATDPKVGEITFLHSLEGVQVELYKVGGSDEEGNIVLADAFQAYQVDLTEENAASVLAEYIVRDKEELGIVPLQTQFTAKHNGSDAAQAIFTNLDPAIYLLISSDAVDGEQRYLAQPCMLQLPQWADETTLNYHITIHGKYDLPPIEEKTEIKVLKVWSGDTAKERPESIEVQLLQDGKLCETVENAEVTLNEKNNWTYEWKGLDGNSTWTVVEKKAPSGYKVSKSKDGTTICITNTYSSDSPPNNGGKLPQTGQNWANILMLFAAGLFFLLVGIVLLQRNRK